MGGFLEEQRSKLRPARWVVVSPTRRLEEELPRKMGQDGQGPREKEEHKLERNEKDEGWWCHEMGPERSEVKKPSDSVSWTEAWGSWVFTNRALCNFVSIM